MAPETLRITSFPNSAKNTFASIGLSLSSIDETQAVAQVDLRVSFVVFAHRSLRIGIRCARVRGVLTECRTRPTVPAQQVIAIEQAIMQQQSADSGRENALSAGQNTVGFRASVSLGETAKSGSLENKQMHYTKYHVTWLEFAAGERPEWIYYPAYQEQHLTRTDSTAITIQCDHNSVGIGVLSLDVKDDVSITDLNEKHVGALDRLWVMRTILKRHCQIHDLKIAFELRL